MNQEVVGSKDVRESPLLNGLELLLENIDILGEIVDCLGEVRKSIKDTNERLCNNSSSTNANAFGQSDRLAFFVASIRLDNDTRCSKQDARYHILSGSHKSSDYNFSRPSIASIVVGTDGMLCVPLLVVLIK